VLSFKGPLFAWFLNTGSEIPCGFENPMAKMALEVVMSDIALQLTVALVIGVGLLGLSR
jgi:hypothetical protein